MLKVLGVQISAHAQHPLAITRVALTATYDVLATARGQAPMHAFFQRSPTKPPCAASAASAPVRSIPAPVRRGALDATLGSPARPTPCSGSSPQAGSLSQAAQGAHAGSDEADGAASAVGVAAAGDSGAPPSEVVPTSGAVGSNLETQHAGVVAAHVTGSASDHDADAGTAPGATAASASQHSASDAMPAAGLVTARAPEAQGVARTALGDAVAGRAAPAAMAERDDTEVAPPAASSGPNSQAASEHAAAAAPTPLGEASSVEHGSVETLAPDNVKHMQPVAPAPLALDEAELSERRRWLTAAVQSADAEVRLNRGAAGADLRLALALQRQELRREAEDGRGAASPPTRCLAYLFSLKASDTLACASRALYSENVYTTHGVLRFCCMMASDVLMHMCATCRCKNPAHSTASFREACSGRTDQALC